LTQLRPMQIAATMIVVFCVSFGVLWRQRNHAGEPAPLQSAALSMPPPIAESPVRQPVSSGLVAQRPAERGANSRPSQMEEPAPYDSGAELPVVVGIVPKQDLFRDQSTNFEAVWKKVNEGIISNGADKPLTITVIDTDVPTQQATQATFELAKGAQRHFGTHDGLTMLSGDQLTLRSPSYRDMIQPVP